MTLPRFHAPDLDPERGAAVLQPDESHHLLHVMRLGAGDEVAIFDGRGRTFRARVERPARQGVEVRILEPLSTEPEPRIPLELVQAVLKGDRMDAVVRDAVMAGASHIAPVVTERSLIRLASLGRARAVERWQRVAIASAKQCGRSRLPLIEAPRSFQDWVAAPPAGLRLLLIEPSADGAGVRPLREALASPAPARVSCVVGPEGGWSAAERSAAAEAGCVAVTLGTMTLRADAAGLVALSVVGYALEDIPPG